MELFTGILEMGNIKKFEKKPIDEKEIGVILYSATHAPSAVNSQEWEFIVVRDEKIKEKVAKAAWDQNFVKQAPVIFVVCADIEKMEMKYGDLGQTYAIEDISYATMNMLLASHALGLGSALIQAFEEDKLKTALSLRKNLKPISIIAVGHPAEEPEEQNKILFENFTYLNYHGNRYNFETKQIGNFLKEEFKKRKNKTKKDDFG